MPAISLSSREARMRGPMARWILGGYWLLLVLSTHWPNSWTFGGEPSYPDKPVHFLAYSVLAFLALAASRAAATSDRRRFWLVTLAIWFAVVVFGLVDETTQPLTGRDFEWFDWLADIAGATCGLALGIVCFRRRAMPGC
jgi:VanZ family protein